MAGAAGDGGGVEGEVCEFEAGVADCCFFGKVLACGWLDRGLKGEGEMVMGNVRGLAYALRRGDLHVCPS